MAFKGTTPRSSYLTRVEELGEARATIARLEADAQEFDKQRRFWQGEASRVGASAARMRLALETLEGRWLCDCSLDGVTCENKPTCPDMIVALALDPEGHPLDPLPGGLVDSAGVFWPTCATCGKTHRDPAPLEWLAAHDAEVVEPYREALAPLMEAAVKATPGEWYYDPLWDPEDPPMVWDSQDRAVAEIDPSAADDEHQVVANALFIVAARNAANALQRLAGRAGTEAQDGD